MTAPEDLTREPAASRPYMPGYGILGPAEGEGLLAWAWAEAQLRASAYFWLATRWPDGRPHLMPVWAVWYSGALWFSSSKGSRKARNLAADPRCTLSTVDAGSPVVLEGTAELLADAADLAALVREENAKYGTSYGLESVDPATNCAYRVRPQRAFGLRADQFTGTPTRWMF